MIPISADLTGGTYQAFGIDIESDIALTLPRGRPARSPQLFIRAVRDLKHARALCEPLINDDPHGGRRPARHQVYRTAEYAVVHLAEAGTFQLTDGEILYWPGRSTSPDVIRRYLTAFVLNIWMELNGTPVVHGAAVEIADGCAVFLAPGGTGKSTLAASFASRGLRFLSDDAVRLAMRSGTPCAIPAHPGISLWSAPAVWTSLGTVALAPRVDPNSTKRIFSCPSHTFCPDPRPVRAVYVLERRDVSCDAGPSLRRLSWLEASRALVQQSMVPHHVAALGLESRRLLFLGRLATAARVMKLEYGSGLDHLDALCDRILDDCARPTGS